MSSNQDRARVEDDVTRDMGPLQIVGGTPLLREGTRPTGDVIRGSASRRGALSFVATRDSLSRPSSFYPLNSAPSGAREISHTIPINRFSS